MQASLMRAFLTVAGVLFLVTGLAKVISGLGSSAILATDDPFFHISFRLLFLSVGTLELYVALVCFVNRSVVFKACLVAGVATNILFYRVGLFWIHWTIPCSCLGNLTEALHISPQWADAGMKMVLTFLLVGSYLVLFTLLRKKHGSIAGRSNL